MQKILILLISLIICKVFAATYHSNYLSYLSNKTPKNKVYSNNICDECQEIIQKSIKFIDNQSKMAELKAILSLICFETSYKTECKLFVKNLEIFLKKIRPFLNESHTICEKLHVCNNYKIDRYHKIGMFFAEQYIGDPSVFTDLLCDECQFAAQEIKTFIDDENNIKELKDYLDKICLHLGKLSGTCTVTIEELLPDFIDEIKALLNNEKQFCIKVKLCKQTIENEKDLSNSYEDDFFSKKKEKVNKLFSNILNSF